jgi:phosphatidylethanolamine/phosphatidyl-N-methylethanolamine N-methyltransferase
MRSEPDFEAITAQHIKVYDRQNYDKGIVGYVMRRGHEILDRSALYDPLSSIIEVGAGSGVHLSFRQTPFRPLSITDSNDQMLTVAKSKHEGA